MGWLYLRKTTLFLVFILHVSADAQGELIACMMSKIKSATDAVIFTDYGAHEHSIEFDFSKSLNLLLFTVVIVLIHLLQCYIF